MKKNIFKFAYIALAIASVIVMSHKAVSQSQCNFDSCYSNCDSIRQSCINSTFGNCAASGGSQTCINEGVTYCADNAQTCYNGCYSQYQSCMGR